MVDHAIAAGREQVEGQSFVHQRFRKPLAVLPAPNRSSPLGGAEQLQLARLLKARLPLCLIRAL